MLIILAGRTALTGQHFFFFPYPTNVTMVLFTIYIRYFCHVKKTFQQIPVSYIINHVCPYKKTSKDAGNGPI